MVSVIPETLSWFDFTRCLVESGIQRLRQGRLVAEGKEDSWGWTDEGSPVVPLPNKCIYRDPEVSGFSLARIRTPEGIDIAPLPGEIQTYDGAAEIARLVRIGECELPWR